ncbi:MAG: hypothetical protein Q7S64_01360 [bacterium]|nr:hypothetical protein [bacterium]
MPEIFGTAQGFVNFTRNRLPSVLTALKGQPLQVCFGSYRRTAGFTDGTVDTGQTDLTVTVANGKGKDLSTYGRLAWDLFKLEAAPIIQETGPGTPERERGTGRLLRGQQLVTVGQALTGITDDTGVLVCLYAGPSARQLVVDTVQSFRQQHPRATIILTSCLCQPESEFNDSLADYVLFAQPCGVEVEMGQLLRNIIELWPLTVPA